MRMWMVDPAIMCRKHLLGEHVELHMAAAHLLLGRKVDGWADNNCLQPEAIGVRPKALTVEMTLRGYRHTSPLRQPRVLKTQRPEACVNSIAAKVELTRRCAECARRAS
jgi:hypothetical protein